MADQVLIYISAADDLGFEREVLSRAIAEVPTTLAWRIVQTPTSAEEPDLQSIVDADVHVLLLGGDVRAPVGVEWLAAKRAGHLPRLYLKRSSVHTQAAQAFMHELGRYAEWHPFDDPTALRRQVMILLSDYLLSHHEHFNLQDEEYQKLNDWRKNLMKKKQQKVDDTRGGADKSSYLISTERYVPSEGVLLHAPDSPTIESTEDNEQ